MTSEEVVGLVQIDVHGYVQSGSAIGKVTSDATSNAAGNASSSAASSVSLQVSSAGGVGTTGLMRELGRALAHPMNDPFDDDGRKHRPYPVLKRLKPFRAANVTKILFLHGDPVHAVLSLYRRHYAKTQAKKLRADRTKTEPFPKTVEEYSKADSELFGLEEHFDSFFQQCDYPIAFLRMEAKTLHLEELAEFVEADVGQLRRHLSPWALARVVEEAAEEEMLAEPGATVSEEMLMKRVEDTLGDVRFDTGASEGAIMDRVRSRSGALRPKSHHYKVHHYKEVSQTQKANYEEVSQQAMGRISQRFASLTSKLKKLGDWQVFKVEGCKNRHLE